MPKSLTEQCPIERRLPRDAHSWRSLLSGYAPELGHHSQPRGPCEGYLSLVSVSRFDISEADPVLTRRSGKGDRHTATLCCVCPPVNRFKLPNQGMRTKERKSLPGDKALKNRGDRSA